MNSFDRRDAIAACTRALAESPAVDIPSASDESTLVALRAAGDRAAVRTRFHDSVCHAEHRPRNPIAGGVFDALEHARLEAIGVDWLPGVAQNLLAHPGAPRSTMQWLAQEALIGRHGPANVARDVERAREEMRPDLWSGLVALRASIHSQRDYAGAAAAWAELASRYAWCAALSARGSEPSTSRVRGADQAAGVDPESAKPSPSASIRARPGRSANDARAVDGTRYVAYTTQHDRVIDASALAEPAELAALRARLSAEFGETRRAITRLANRLRRILISRQTRHWRFDLDEGLIDAARLASVVAAPSEARPFKAESDSPFPSTAVTLLIDCSGSMRGRPMLVAALTVELLVGALERCGITSEVLGFTTRDWSGGRPHDAWVSAGEFPNPGRLNALEHIVFKPADVPWLRARRGLGVLVRTDLLKENIDGEAVQWAHDRLLCRPERRKLMLVVSDGEPHDEATERANGAAYLIRHLRAVVQEIEDHSPVELAAVGVGHDVLRFYSRAVVIASADELGEALVGFLETFFAGSSVAPAIR